MEKPVILRADHLKKHFAVTKGLLIMKVIGWVKAVDDISFTIRQGETLALVGESGCARSRPIFTPMNSAAGSVSGSPWPAP